MQRKVYVNSCYTALFLCVSFHCCIFFLLEGTVFSKYFQFADIEPMDTEGQGADYKCVRSERSIT